MKNLLKVAVVFSFVLGSSFTFASNNKRIIVEKNTTTVNHSSTFQAVVFPVKDKAAVRVNFSNQGTAPVKISIGDRAGNGLFTDVQKAASANLKYDFSNLGAGEYEMTISTGTTVQKHTLIIEESTSNMMAQISDVLENREAVRVVFAQAGQPVNISVATASGDEVYVDQSFAAQDQKVVFVPVEKLPAGDYMVTVSDNDRSYQKLVTVEK